MAGVDLPVRAIREQVSSAIDLVVQQTRFKDGTRHITHVTEVVGMEGDVITLQDLFLFDHGAGFDDNGRSLGTLKSTGLRPEVPRQAGGRGRPGRPLHLRLREVRGAMSVRRTLTGVAVAALVLLAARGTGLRRDHLDHRAGRGATTVS